MLGAATGVQRLRARYARNAVDLGSRTIANMALEVDSFWLQRLAGEPNAKWVARMSVTILWGLYARGSLWIGFWRHVRPLRLAALGLSARSLGDFGYMPARVSSHR